jgi:hypothetical protein
METDPADQPTIEQLLNFHEVVDYLQPEQFAALLQELELRDSILRDDAVKRALEKLNATL